MFGVSDGKSVCLDLNVCYFFLAFLLFKLHACLAFFELKCHLFLCVHFNPVKSAQELLKCNVIMYVFLDFPFISLFLKRYIFFLHRGFIFMTKM